MIVALMNWNVWILLISLPRHPTPSSQSTMQPSREGFDQSFALAQQPTSSLARGTVQTAPPQHYEPAFSRPTPRLNPRKVMSQYRELTRACLSSTTPPSYASVVTPQRKQGRKPFVLVVGLLVILLLGGIGVWVGVFHPFSVPDVVQPQQSFSNSQLAFSVQYPSGWDTRVDSSYIQRLFRRQ